MYIIVTPLSADYYELSRMRLKALLTSVSILRIDRHQPQAEAKAAVSNTGNTLVIAHIPQYLDLL